MTVEEILVPSGSKQELRGSLEKTKIPLYLENGEIVMAKGKKSSRTTSASIDPFADQEAVVKKIDQAMRAAAAEAREENDRLGIPTPVRIQGKVGYVFKGKRISLDKS